MPASVIGHTAVVRLLLEAGADKDATDKVRPHITSSFLAFFPALLIYYMLTFLLTLITRSYLLLHHPCS
jgi:hypothetical protein